MIFTAMFFDNWLIDNRLCVHLYESFLNAHLAVNADAELRQSINRSGLAKSLRPRILSQLQEIPQICKYPLRFPGLARGNKTWRRNYNNL